MQRTFVRPDEKALLMSASYDFAEIGVDGLKAIVNFVAGFDGKAVLLGGGERRDSQEVDVTLDFRIGGGWLESFWLRVRGSFLHDEGADENGTDFRVILRYELPVI